MWRESWKVRQNASTRGCDHIQNKKAVVMVVGLITRVVINGGLSNFPCISYV